MIHLDCMQVTGTGRDTDTDTTTQPSVPTATSPIHDPFFNISHFSIRSMEAIGVLGSVIAIGQALGALPQIVETLRSIGNVKGEFANLLNELADLRDLQTEIQLMTEKFFLSHGAAFSIPHESSLSLKNTIEQLKTLIQDLEILASGFRQYQLKRHAQVTNAIRWQWSRKKVADLRSRANRCRTDLHRAMTMLLLFGQSAQFQHLLEVHSVTTTVTPRLEGLLEQIRDGSPDSHPTSETKNSDPESTEAKRTVDIQTINHNLESRLSKEPSHGDRISDGITADHSITVETKVHISCGLYCSCQCHSSRAEFKSPPWLRTLLGSFLLSYSGRQLFHSQDTTLVCDQPTCQNNQPPSYLHYYFPTWLCNRAICFTASLSSFSSYGATLHMTLPRMLDRKADIWYHIMHGDNRKIALWIKRHGVLPADRFDTGITLLSYAIHKGYYDVIKCLMQTWPRRLVQKSYDWYTFAFAERELALGRIPSNMENMVKELLYLWNEDLDPVSFAGPEEYGGDIQLDRLLQRACILGDAEHLRSLISAGANINMPDFEGKTPLHLALISKNYHCASVLVDSGCDIFARESIFGNIPLAHAFEGQATAQLFQVLSRLIPKTAETYKTMFGCTAMHELSRLRGGNLDEVFQLLIDAGQDIEARHEDGETPILGAVSRNNSAVFKILASAGASLTTLTKTRSSILHYAAHVADAELLQCLLETGISIDIDLRNSAGHTALDTFRYCLLADPDLFPSHWRRPNEQERALFEELLRNSRDRYLEKEICTLDSIISLLRQDNIEQARLELHSLITEKMKYDKRQEAEAIQEVKDVQIRHGMIDAAIEALQKIIEDHRETIAVSPFSRPSVFDRDQSESQDQVKSRDDNTKGCDDNMALDLGTIQRVAYCPSIDWNFC